MGIGIYYLSGWDISQEVLLKKIKNVGFDYIGLYWEDETDDQISKRVSICRDIGLRIEAMHGPLKNNMLIWDENKYENDYFLKLKHMIKKSAEFGIGKFVLHPCGKEATSFNKTGLKRFKDLVKLCESLNIQLLLENLRTVDNLIYVLEKIKSKNLDICFDTGHANVWCYPPLEFVKKFKYRIKTVHINDNFATPLGDYHLIPGEGNIKWPQLINILYKYYKGPIMLELNNFKLKEKSYNNLDEYLENAFNSAQKLLSYIK